MSQFDQETIDKVRASIDIVDLIGKDIKLEQRGRSHVGLCPFHDEKTPSFNVNQENQLYYCFGCGSGGNVFNYIMNTQNISFPEAVTNLAERGNVGLPKLSATQQRLTQKHKQLIEVNYQAARYYYRLLRSEAGRQARSYLDQRGINGSLAKTFFLGYASSKWDGLLNFLAQNGIEQEIMEEAGLVIKGKNGYYDRFRNRIIFPICDPNERFLGFGGRIIGEGNPKYLNSPETAVFHKSKSLYGINWAKKSIKIQDFVVLVEGYTDCISLHAKGLENVVASLGTAFTEEHARLIRKYTSNVVIAFDSDAAGARATQRGVPLLNKAGLKVKVAMLPSGLDPDTFAREHTKDQVNQWAESAIPYIEHQIKSVISQFNIDSREGKLDASQELVTVLSKIENAIEREEYSNYVSNLLSIDRIAIDQELSKLNQDSKLKLSSGTTGKFSHITSKNRYTIKDLRSKQVNESKSYTNHQIDSYIMRLILADASLIEQMQALGFSSNSFQNTDYQHLYDLLANGEWDKQGEAAAQQLFTLPEPSGEWHEYLKQFQVIVWHRSLKKIEENLSSVENDNQADVLMEICRLIKQYNGVRREVIFAQKGN